MSSNRRHNGETLYILGIVEEGGDRGIRRTCISVVGGASFDRAFPIDVTSTLRRIIEVTMKISIASPMSPAMLNVPVTAPVLPKKPCSHWNSRQRWMKGSIERRR